MNFIKLVLIFLGLIFGFMLLSWIVGLVGTLLWYGFWIGILAAGGYGAYKIFRKAEEKYVGPGSASGYIDEGSYDRSLEEYRRKYLNK